MGEHTDKTKGHVKQAVGAITGNDKMKRDGARDTAKGHLAGAANEVKAVVKDMRKSQKHGSR